MEKAIPLITCPSSGSEEGSDCTSQPDNCKFEVNPEAIEILKQVKGPLGVIAVAGMYRTGKSYFRNRVLLNR